jgi:type II secretory pathway pseudopilin PulG
MRRALVHGGASASAAAARYTPGRLTFRLDLLTDPDAAGYAEQPRVTLRPAAECPEPEAGVFDALPPALLQAVSEVAAAVRQGSAAVQKLRKRRRRQERELAQAEADRRRAQDEARGSERNKSTLAATTNDSDHDDDDDDDDDNIFGGVGEYDFGEPLKPSGLPDIGAAAGTPSGKPISASGLGHGTAPGSGEGATKLLRAGVLTAGKAGEEGDSGKGDLVLGTMDAEDDEGDDMVEGFIEDARDDGYGDMGVSGQGGTLGAQSMASFYAVANKTNAAAAGGAKTASKYEMPSEKELAKRKTIADKRRFEQELKAVEGIIQRRQDGGESGGPDAPSSKRAKPGTAGFMQ